MADPIKAVDDVAPETAEEVVQDFMSTVQPIIDYAKERAVEMSEVYLSIDGLLRLGIIIGAGFAAYYLSKPIRAALVRVWPVSESRQTETDTEAETLTETRRSLVTVSRLVYPLIWSILLWIATGVLGGMGQYNDLLRVAASLLNAWVVIRLFSGFVRNPVISKSFAAFAWAIAALNILQLLNPTIALLDSAAITMGETRLSLYMVIKGGVIAFLLLWGANFLTSFIQSRIQSATSLTPSMQTLIGQTVRLGLLFGALMLALNVIGIDLTALAVFSGAIGIGIGFGLQAIFSNLVAGIIMLFEGSIKVGDFVDLDNGLTGEVKEINIRSTRIMTNDNVDILVPNAEFINNRVTNWTLKEGHRRTRIPFGVAYGTDKDLVAKAVLEASKTVKHELTGRGAKPAEVWLTNFGESSLDFELVLWLRPSSVKRPGKVAADYNWAIETALTKYGIEIPFPQRDLHIRSGNLPIKIERTPGAKAA